MKKNYDKLIGIELRKIRESKKISLRQLSELTKISHPALSNYELGKRSLYVKQLKIICDALNIDLLEFLDSIYE